MPKVPHGGLPAVIDLVNHLDDQQKNKILDELAKKDAKLVALIREQMINMDLIKDLTPMMIRELLQEISLADLAKALRLADDSIKNHLLSNISRNQAQDLKEELNGPPIKKAKAVEAKNKLLEILRAKIEAGKFVVGKNKDEMV